MPLTATPDPRVVARLLQERAALLDRLAQIDRQLAAAFDPGTLPKEAEWRPRIDDAHPDEVAEEMARGALRRRGVEETNTGERPPSASTALPDPGGRRGRSMLDEIAALLLSGLESEPKPTRPRRDLPVTKMVAAEDVVAALGCAKSTAYQHLRAALGGTRTGKRGLLRVPVKAWEAYVERTFGATLPAPRSVARVPRPIPPPIPITRARRER